MEYRVPPQPTNGPAVNKDVLAYAQERITLGLRTITTDHAAVHAGEGYAYNQRADAVANGGTMLVEFNTPAAASGYVHMKRIEEWGEGSMNLLELIEAPTLTTGATPGTAAQRNRNSTRTSAVTIKTNPTTISGGTTLEAFRFGGGGGASGVGGSRSMDIEWILKPSTTYLFRLTNNSGTAKSLALSLFWYEEEAGI